MSSHFLRLRRLYIRLAQIAVIAVCFFADFQIRFDFSVPASELPLLTQGILLAIVVKLVAFHLAGIDRGWWRYVGLADLHRVVLANVGGSLGMAASEYLMFGPRFPRSIVFIDFMLCLLVTAGLRFSVRLYYESVAADVSGQTKKGILVYGAGAAGLTLVREIRVNRGLGCQVIGFLDDNPAKIGAVFLGVKVMGCGRDAARIVDRYQHRRPRVEEIVIAMPSANGRAMRDALANSRAAGVTCKTIPGVGELLSGKVLSSQIREVSVLDLLGREPVKLDENQLEADIAGRSIMVTGAAGSIGSELCRQLLRFRPRKLVLFEQAESELFRIDMELAGKKGNIEIVPQIGDIRDYERVEEVIRKHRVDSMFHAAAYKHVPMMELHIFEAVTNNVLGTNNLMRAAHRNRVGSFVMISSDKAVNPTNIMGLTKRVAELMVSSMPSPEEKAGATKFLSVRFGNVLGSNGSVIPIFKAQIEAGGPVTVTHPEMRRYFMTIPEAVQLVLQASSLSKGSEIFLLNMGEPVSIVELARNMIRLSGHQPDVDIELRFTGLRPGEKLFEELVIDGENIERTSHEKIRILRGFRPSADYIAEWVGQLQSAVASRDERCVIALLSKLVPEYHPVGRWRELAAPIPTGMDPIGESSTAAAGA